MNILNRSRGSLKNKTALVTAGTSPLGSAIVRALAREGAKVAFTYFNNIKEARNLEKHGTAIQADLKDSNRLEIVLSGIIKQAGPINILVNNFGPIKYMNLRELDIADFKSQLEENLLPLFFLCQHVGRMMSDAGGGRIINIAAAGAGEIQPKKKTVPYHIAKNGVVMLSKSFAREFANNNVTVNSVSPGILGTATDAEEGSVIGKFDIPAGKKGTPGDIANVVVFLAQPASGYITGQNIDVDGGWCL